MNSKKSFRNYFNILYLVGFLFILIGKILWFVNFSLWDDSLVDIGFLLLVLGLNESRKLYNLFFI